MDVKLKSNQILCIIGDSPLGDWKPHDAIKMHKSPFHEQQVYWEASLDLPSEIPINYKYVIRGKDRSIKWESGKSEYRTIVPRGFEMIIDDGQFGQESGSIWVDEGWLTSEMQLRIELGFHEPLTGEYRKPLEIHNSETNENHVSLHFYDGHQVISHEIIDLPLSDMWTEVVFHTHSLTDLKIYIELYTVSEDRIQKRFGKAVLNCNKLQKRGYASLEIFNVDLDYVGDLNLKYLVITPFRHKNNDLSTMWNSIATKPVGKSFGHRGCGTTRTSVICMLNIAY